MVQCPSLADSAEPRRQAALETWCRRAERRAAGPAGSHTEILLDPAARCPIL